MFLTQNYFCVPRKYGFTLETKIATCGAIIIIIFMIIIWMMHLFGGVLYYQNKHEIIKDFQPLRISAKSM